MPGSEVFWRLLGQRARPGNPEPIVPVADFLQARSIGAGFITPFPLTGYRFHCHYAIDPPVGGFGTPMSTIIALPNNLIQGVLTTVDATGAIPAGGFFPPGIYQVMVQYEPTASMAAAAAYALQIIRADVASLQTGVAVTPLPTRSLCQIPMIRGASIATLHTRLLRFAAEEPWRAVLTNLTAMLDGDAMDINVDFECSTPLDQPVGT